MQRFLREANAFQERQRRIIEGLRGPFAFASFRTLLEAEGFATLPRTLAARMRREAPAILVADEKANHRAASTLQPIGGVCTEVLDLLQDCVVPPKKIFGLLREVVPRRQVEIARLMIALERVKLNFARVLTYPAVTTH